MGCFFLFWGLFGLNLLETSRAKFANLPSFFLFNFPSFSFKSCCWQRCMGRGAVQCPVVLSGHSWHYLEHNGAFGGTCSVSDVGGLPLPCRGAELSCQVPKTILFIYLSSFAAPMERTLVTLFIFSPAIT